MSHRFRIWALLVFLLVGLVGCVHPRTTVNIIGDKFSPAITLEGIPLHDPHNGDDLFWMLRSFVNPQAHQVEHQIYVAWTFAGRYSGRYFASDDTARPLPVKMILKESCRGCEQTDTLGISIDEATLRARATTGFEVKLSAQDGTAGILSITPQMISAQLEAENRILAAGASLSTTASLQPAAPTQSNAAPSPSHIAPAQNNVPPPPNNAPTPAVSVAPPAAPLPPADPGVGLQMLLYRTSEITRGSMHGAIIVAVIPDSPAALAGIHGGDFIVGIDGQAVDSGPDVRDVLAKIKPNSSVKVDIVRGSANITVDLKL